MADSFFGFDTSLSNLNDDEGGGEPSEDEYDALNDETFGHESDEFDWEVEHEALAGQLESSRRHNVGIDDAANTQLEESLCQLVLDETDAPQSRSLGSSVWRHDAPFPATRTPVPTLKNVHTVEELERQMRQKQMAQQNYSAQNYFQPRFPPISILQRPPGLQAPVPLPFAPQQPMGHMNQPLNKIVGQNQMGQNNLMQNHLGPNVNQMNQNMNQMGQSMNQMGHNVNQFMQNANQMGQFQNNQMGQGNMMNMSQNMHQNQMMPNQMGQNMNQMGQNMNQMGQNVNQMGQNMNQMGQGMNHMGPNLNQMGQNLNPMVQTNQMGQNLNQMGQNMNQMMPNGNQYGPGMNQFPHMMNQPRMMGPPPGINMPRQNFNPTMGQFNPNFRAPMPPQPTDQSAMTQQNAMMNQHLQQMKTQSINKPNQPNQPSHPNLSPQNKKTQKDKDQKVQKSRIYQNSKNTPSQNMTGQNMTAQNMTAQNMTAQNMTSQNLVQLIQNTHPMLQYNNSYHNASHHPMLNNKNYMSNNQFNHPMLNQRQNGSFSSTMHSMNGDESSGSESDEYAGLMSQREKQWLLNIQMLQLNTGTPYIHDFYYTVFLERQASKEKEHVKEAHKANQQNHPFYSGGVKQETHTHRERHNSNRHNSTSEDGGTPRTYVPAQFENSLGKLQCGSVTAPRKIIDVEVVGTEPPTGMNSRAPSRASTTAPTEVPREMKRTKQLLLDIEALYLILLRLEELNDPLAISNALILKEREEKQKQLEAAQKDEVEEEDTNLFLRNIESVHRRPKADAPKTDAIDKRQVVNLAINQKPAPVKNLLDEDKDELVNKMFAGLLHSDRLAQMLSVRKGKRLVCRFVARAPPGHARMRAVWARVLRALPAAARRDAGSLAALHAHYRKYIQSTSGWAPVLESCSLLSEALDPARTPVVLTTPLTLSCVCALIEKATQLVNTPDATPNERQWSKFLKTLVRALKNATVSVARPVQPLPESKVLYHLKQLDSRTTIEILQRGKTAEFSDLTKVDVSEQLVKHLC